MEANFFNLYFSNSDFKSEVERFNLENIVHYDFVINDYLGNGMKTFDCMWTKVYQNTIDGEYGQKKF